jgi:RimJ/RimL family protein N-acetyltransferase
MQLMKSKKILATERLILKEFSAVDAEFILLLLNTPAWLQFIGDKNVHNIQEAEDYLTNGPIASYKENGFGLWLVSLKESGEPIGMCGLIKRDYLDFVDIGFALMPEYEGLGYGFEMAEATMSYSRDVLKIDKVIAITDENNEASIKLLNKIGLQFEKIIEAPQADVVCLYS